MVFGRVRTDGEEPKTEIVDATAEILPAYDRLSRTRTECSAMKKQDHGLALEIFKPELLALMIEKREGWGGVKISEHLPQSTSPQIRSKSLTRGRDKSKLRSDDSL